MPTNGRVPSFGGVGCAGRNSALISPANVILAFTGHPAVSCPAQSALSIPGLVLDRRRRPDPLVDPLEVLFLGDFLPRRNLCVLRLGGTGKVVPIDPRCGDQTGYRAPTSRAALEGRVIHPVQHLVDDQAGRAFVLVNRHSLLLDARGKRVAGNGGRPKLSKGAAPVPIMLRRNGRSGRSGR